MRYINVRQLLHNFNEEIENLPLTITKFGRPLAVIEGTGGRKCIHVGCKNAAKWLVEYEGKDLVAVTGEFCDEHLAALKKWKPEEVYKVEGI